jgi:ABC-2 type transport system permease protein
MGNLRLEIVKILHQKRTYVGWAALLAVPVITVVAGALSKSGPPDPNEPAFVAQMTGNGLLVPLVSLLGLATFLLPLIAAMGGASPISSEAELGTLKTWLSRPVSRGVVLLSKWGVAVLYATAGVVFVAVMALILGALTFGVHPLVTLSGTTLTVPHALVLIAASCAVVLLGALCSLSLALLISTFTDSSLSAAVIAVVVFTVLTILNVFSYFDFMRPYTYTTYRLVFVNLFRYPIYWRPIEQALLDYTATIGGLLVVAWLVFGRRDILT